MLDLTLRHGAGRIHLGTLSSDFLDCDDHLTHLPLDSEDVRSLLEYLHSVKQDPVAMSDLRRLLAQASVTQDLTRASNHQVTDQVTQLLLRGSLSAVKCGIETLEPAASISIEGKPYHIGLSLGHAAACYYERNHRVVRFENSRETADFFAKLVEDSENVKELKRFALAQTHFRDLTLSSSNDMVVENLTSLVASRRLTVVECGLFSFQLAGDIGEDEYDPRKARKDRSDGSQSGGAAAGGDKVKTWIEIKLVDLDGKPVANEKYQLKLPDGSTKEGALDDKGAAKVEEIDPGECTVCFPDIDRREWKPV